MKTENEINTTVSEKPNKVPSQLPEVPPATIELPDITPVVKTKEITDGKLDDYTDSLNSLVTKYAKPISEKK